MLHLLYATPVLRGVIRGEQVQPIQELLTLTTSIRSRVFVWYRMGKQLKFTARRGRVHFTVPKLIGHQMVEVAY